MRSDPYPRAAAVVVRDTLNPCARIAVPDRALPPCSGIAVPDGCVHVRHGDHTGGHAGVVAGVAGGRGGLAVVQHQCGVALREIRLHGIEQCGVGGRVQGVGDGVSVEFAGQCSKRTANLCRALDSCFQALIVGTPKGQLFGCAAGACAGAGDLQSNLRDDLSLQRCASPAKYHHSDAAVAAARPLIGSLTCAVGGARVPGG